MIDHLATYRAVTELTADKFPVVDEKTGDTGEADQNYDLRKAALNRAHAIRQFEIELYWKRANYFWLLQAAVFAATGLTWRSGGAGFSQIIPVALAALGGVTAFAGWLSAQGSKFWQENWEHHIDMLEDEFEGRLHKTAYVGKGGVAWSVSGVNERLSLCFGVFWVVILGITSLYANAVWKDWLKATLDHDRLTIAATILVWLVGLAAAWWLSRRKTDLSKYARGVSYHHALPEMNDFGLVDAEKLQPVNRLAKLKKPFLIRREPKI